MYDLLSLHYFTVYIIFARKIGAYIETVETHGRMAPSLVAHYDYDCIVDKVADCFPVEKQGGKKPQAPKKVTEKHEVHHSSSGEALFGETF